MKVVHDVDVVELGADDLDLLTGFVEVENAVNAVDAPWVHPSTVVHLQSRIRYGWELEPGRHFAASTADGVVAVGVVETGEWDNRDLAWLQLSVRPDLRRRGIGAALHAHLRQVAREMGRTKVGADSWDGSPGEVFAVRHGLERRYAAINRRQHLAEVSMSDVAALHAEATGHASAYEVLRIPGPVPEELLEPLSVMTAAINDAPLDDLDLEDEVFPPQRIRDYETAQLSRGHRLYRVVARHRETGELAGHTVVAVESDRPAIGHQHDTSVVRAHRGHRLGLLLKSEMNLWLADEEPGLETVDTWNAESNDHMIAVNELLGYRWMGRGLAYQGIL